MERKHHYALTVTWTGNKGSGTSKYNAYDRSHLITAANKAGIQASSDPALLGDPTKYNPEELLVAALSSCHMLWYLHLCAEAGVIVLSYEDHATGVMAEQTDGRGRFTEVVLHPVITVAEAAMTEQAALLHEQAHAQCFIARSVNFKVTHRPEISVK